MPAADLYVCTGDMLPDFRQESVIKTRNLSRIRQRECIAMLDEAGGFRKLYLESPDAPVACVRGNHDFVDLAPLFGGDVTELTFGRTTRAGVTIAGIRGTPWIDGWWSDEVRRPDLSMQATSMPDSDLYLTHFPPDERHVGGEYGLAEYSNHLDYLPGDRHRLALFGHIHECGGHSSHHGKVLYVNAATVPMVIDGDPTSGWTAVAA